MVCRQYNPGERRFLASRIHHPFCGGRRRKQLWSRYGKGGVFFLLALATALQPEGSFEILLQGEICEIPHEGMGDLPDTV
jgi:hypothetical protein